MSTPAWAQRWLHSRRALWGITALSALEATVLPVPLEVLLVPFMVANRRRLWRIATLVLLGCLLGAMVGYAVGYLAWNGLGRPLVELFGYEAAWERFVILFDAHGFWAIVAVGITPIPFQVAMLAAGAAHYPVLLFLLAAAFARGIRYYGLALVVTWIGPQAALLWRRNAGWLGGLLLVLFIGLTAWQLAGVGTG